MKIDIKCDNQLNQTTLTIPMILSEENIQNVIRYINSFNKQLSCRKNGRIFQIYIQDIYYIESVDNKCFVYLKNVVFEANYKLYELESELKAYEFIRINKSCLLNLKYLESVKVLVYGKYEARLFNHEKLIISRKYMPEIKRVFGL